MEEFQREAAVGAGMIGVGMLQAGYGALRGDWVFTALGVLYAILAVGSLRDWVGPSDR